jgi:hypothetical protein
MGRALARTTPLRGSFDPAVDPSQTPDRLMGPCRPTRSRLARITQGFRRASASIFSGDLISALLVSVLTRGVA